MKLPVPTISMGALASDITRHLSTPKPDEATMRRLFATTAPDQPTQKLMTRLWTMVKTGR